MEIIECGGRKRRCTSRLRVLGVNIARVQYAIRRSMFDLLCENKTAVYVFLFGRAADNICGIVYKYFYTNDIRIKRYHDFQLIDWGELAKLSEHFIIRFRKRVAKEK